MASETRGQNSFVNFTPLNAELMQRINRMNGVRYEAKRARDQKTVAEMDALLREAWGGFQFAPQKSLLLPPEYLDPQFTGGVPSYIQPLIKPEPGTTTAERLTHFSQSPELEALDPRRYGTGIAGEEMGRLKYTQNPVMERSYFYTGENPRPEPGLGPYRYGAESQGLYNLEEDPVRLRTLAAEANRTPYTSPYNQGITDPGQAITDVERMAREYGYEGIVNPQQRTAVMFNPTPVQRYQRGGAVKEKVKEGVRKGIKGALDMLSPTQPKTLDIPEMGINVRTDNKLNLPYADLIVDGKKIYESRMTDSLRPYVNKSMSIVRTGQGPAKAIGAVDIGEPLIVDAKTFRELQDKHLVPKGSMFDIEDDGQKYLYPLSNARRFDQELDVGHGIKARKVLRPEVEDEKKRQGGLAAIKRRK